MMRTLDRVGQMILMAMCLTACITVDGARNNETSYGPKSIIGTLAGGGMGAYGGSQFGRGSGKTAMTILGSILGASAGYYIGSQLDEADRQMAARAQKMALSAPVGAPFNWANPETGNRGASLASRQGRDVNTGQTCRELVEIWEINKSQYENIVLVCRNDDGSWSSR